MSDEAHSSPSAIDYAALASPHAVAHLTSLLRTIPDFPKPGIQFKDITPLLANPQALHMTLDLMTQPFIGADIHYTVAMEARGFIFGGAMSARLNTGFVPVRKPGKLPAEVDEVSYALEYGESALQMHKGSIARGAKVLIVDDLLATGGTAAATVELVHQQGGVVAGFAFVCELDFLPGRQRLNEIAGDVPVHSLIHIG
jgi:adenine phosphoribosyltransferase